MPNGPPWLPPPGPLASKYAACGGPSGMLGDLAAPPEPQPGGGWGCLFQTGYALYWAPASGAHFVHGAIRAKWGALGGPGGRLGYPTSDETPAAGGGFFNTFQDGYALWWTQATGACLIHGAIEALWQAQGGASGGLGYPVTDETPADGGFFNDFAAGASIVWSQATGAVVVAEPARETWRGAGASGGRLGFPLADAVTTTDGGGSQAFQGGSVRWTAAGGALILPPQPPVGDMLADLGQRLAEAISTAYPTVSAGSALAFLPAGVAVPDDLAPAGGPVNPTQMAAWLEVNFDAPFVVSAADTCVLSKDGTHGSLTQVYAETLASARPVGDPAGDAWARVAAEIASAKAAFGPPGAQTVVCSPDDWPVQDASPGYWITFEAGSSDLAPAPVSGGPAIMQVRPELWRLRSLPVEARPPPVSRPILQMRAAEPEALDLAARLRAPPVHFDLAALMRTDAAPLTAPADVVTLRLEHQVVALADLQAGAPWWNDSFLADSGWCVPGMTKGAVLPPGGDGSASFYARPVALVVIRNLQATARWTDQAAAVLSSGSASLGPLSLAGASPAAEGVAVTYPNGGMQVVALFFQRLPVLPPADDPASASAPTPAPAAS